MVFGENRGDALRGSPRRCFPRGRRKSVADTGKARNLSGDTRTGCLGCSVGPGLKSDVRMRFRFPRKVSLHLPANLRNVFPGRTPICRAPAVEVHSRPRARQIARKAGEMYQTGGRDSAMSPELPRAQAAGCCSSFDRLCLMPKSTTAAPPTSRMPMMSTHVFGQSVTLQLVQTTPATSSGLPWTPM
jgi:hypothetical protein